MVMNDGWKWMGRVLVLGLLVGAPACVEQGGGEESQESECEEDDCEEPELETTERHAMCIGAACKEQ